MELNFVQSSEVFGKNTLAWVTEFKIEGDFNLHIERKKGGDILVYQRTSGSGYAIVEEFRGMDNKPAIDFDILCVVPKFVKIVSESKPTYASITTTDGEITEIKSQSKEVEVTANGTMDITPDAGFSYLNSVKVKTNVPTSGEGGGSASTMEYLVLSATDNFMVGLVVTNFSAFARIYEEGTVVVLPTYALIADGALIPQVNLPIAIAIDFSAKAISGELMTIKDLIIANGVTADQLAAIPRITEGEFYSLDVPEVG